MPSRITLDEATLRSLIEIRLLTHWQVAAMLGVSRNTVERRCREWNLKTQRTGPRGGAGHPEWKGGRNIDKDGYVLIYTPEHPGRRTHTRYVLEHRLVMEKMLGRTLRKAEVVHHKNGNKQDNRPENLMLFEKNADHLRHELSGDFVHALACSCKMRRTAILHSLAGGAPLPRVVSAHSISARRRLVLAACAQLRIQPPAWFAVWSDSMPEPPCPEEPDRRGLFAHSITESAGQP